MQGQHRRSVSTLAIGVFVAAAGTITANAHAQAAPATPPPPTQTPQETSETEVAEASTADQEQDADWHRYHVDVALFPTSTVQMIEGPNRDDTVTRDSIFSGTLGFSYAPLRWIEPGIWLQFDAGNVERVQFTPSNEQGQASELQRVEGSFWELWTAFILRGRFHWAFAEVGWAPLIVRRDSLRTDLENTAGEASGLFMGSRSVAWLGAAGVSVPVAENLDLTGRLQFRIRYLVSRDGEPLARDEENGQMAVYPFLGAHAHF